MPHEKMPPTLNVDESDLPEIKKWEVGKTYKLIVEAEQVEVRKGQPLNDDKKMRAVFKVKKVKPVESDPLKRDLKNTKDYK